VDLQAQLTPEKLESVVISMMRMAESLPRLVSLLLRTRVSSKLKRRLKVKNSWPSSLGSVKLLSPISTTT